MASGWRHLPKEPWEKRGLSIVLALVMAPCSTADGQAQQFPPVCSQPKGDPDSKQNVHEKGKSILPRDPRGLAPRSVAGERKPDVRDPHSLNPADLGSSIT